MLPDTSEGESEGGGGHPQTVGSGRSLVEGSRRRSSRPFWDLMVTWKWGRDMLEIERFLRILWITVEEESGNIIQQMGDRKMCLINIF